jgi:transcriptional regulator with XRE-family HTH domain
MKDDPLTPQEIHDRARAAGLTLDELAERAGITQPTYSRWKSGRSSISLEVYGRLLNALREAEALQRDLRLWLESRPQAPQKLKSLARAHTVRLSEDGSAAT